jgi:hypothetical protein
MPSLWSFPTWLDAYVRWHELYASALRLGPITPQADGTYTFMSEFPR